MKGLTRAVLVAAAAMAVSSCDNATTALRYTPEMASFSNEFDFDPLLGPVKSFTQTVINQAGSVEHRVTATLSEQGCIENITLEDFNRDYRAALVLDGRYYRDAQSNEERIATQGLCQLGEIPATGLKYITNDEGFVIGASASEQDLEIAWQYEGDGFPSGRIARRGADAESTQSKPLPDAKGNLDYQATQTENGTLISSAKQRCDYDGYRNPLSCNLTVQPAGKPAIYYSVENTIDYY